MAVLVRMPSVLAGATEAAINKWLVEEGAAVVEGQPLVELETEKAVVEYNAEVSGTMGKYVIAEGKSASIGDPICVVLAAGESSDAIAAALGGAAPEEAPQDAAAAPKAETAASAAWAPAASTPVIVAQTPVSESPSTERRFASPLARKMAREAGLDLASLVGSGPDNRIVRVDIERAIEANGGPKAPAPVVVATSQPAVVAAAPAAAAVEVPLTGMRKAIARRLVESKQTIPHFYLVADCKVDRLLELRKQVNETEGVKVSVNDLVVLATAKAFLDVPEANVTWGDSVIYQHSSVDISIAVSTEGGLVTPVLRNAANLTLTQLSSTIKDLAERGRSKRLQQHELEGGSFSISNLGMYGTDEFAAIINPPQSGILAVGAAKEQPVVENGIIKAANVMRVTLSADHRAVDGALAAQWLAAFVKRIENPVSLLV
jgi:pyruvate dehydrogenase E2 component (dihydrolipoamide acetyltransferase)